MQFKDNRLLLLTELIENIRIIKFLAYESIILNQIKSIRSKELIQLKYRKYLDSICFKI